MADQVELWSDKFQVRLQKLFSSLPFVADFFAKSNKNQVNFITKTIHKNQVNLKKTH